jgi:hypothetical protein
MVPEIVSPQVMAAELRRVASMLDSLPPDMTISASLRCHGSTQCDVLTLEHLKAARSLMDIPEAKKSKGYRWLQGMFGPIDISAHYAPGLLGTTQRKRVVEYDVERVVDLSLLD